MVSLALAACSADSEEAANQGGQASTSGGAATGSIAATGGTADPTARGGAGGSTGGRPEPSASGGSTDATGGKSQPSEPLPPTGVPRIDSLVAAMDDSGAVAVEFEGGVGLAQVQTITVELLDAAGNEVGRQSGWSSWLARPNRFSGVGSAGHLKHSGARFSGFMSFRDSKVSQRPERVRVTIQDLEENPGEPVEATLSAPSPVLRAEGELCDPFGILDRCEGAAFCDAVDGSGRVAATCRTPAQVCSKDLLELRDSLQASNEESPDDTYASCTYSRGNLGNDQGHVFVASRTGSHRFRAEEIGYQVAVTLFARRFCDFGRQPDSELGCAHVNDFEMGEPLELVLDLEAGETVFVYVEASWVGGGEYVLSVEEPN